MVYIDPHDIPISVIMAVYNGERFLEKAITSILNQSFKQFEFIIIDDYSIDNSAKIIHSFKDDRIKYLKNTSNLGLAASLNKGIKQSNGTYIARMDDDDISKSNRFFRQFNFLKNNPEYGVVGTLADYITEEGEYLSSSKLPEKNDDIKKKLPAFWFHHGSVMIKKEFLIKVGMYDEWSRKIEDLLLWNKLARVCKFYVIQQSLYEWRMTINGATNVIQTKQNEIFYERLKTASNIKELIFAIKEYDLRAEDDQKNNLNIKQRKFQYNIRIAKIYADSGEFAKTIKYILRSLKYKIKIIKIIKIIMKLVITNLSEIFKRIK